MARTHCIATTPGEDSLVLAFTPEEEAAADVVEQEWADATPMRDWKSQMEATDKKMPRYVEDLYDAGVTPSARTKALIDEKKALRGERP